MPVDLALVKQGFGRLEGSRADLGAMESLHARHPGVVDLIVAAHCIEVGAVLAPAYICLPSRRL